MKVRWLMSPLTSTPGQFPSTVVHCTFSLGRRSVHSLQHVALARLKKTCLKKPNKTQQNYDQTPFTLDGHMDLDISLDGKTMCTTVYKKTNAQEQLLQSEGVCSLLGLLHYHPEVEPWRGGRKQIQMQTNSSVPSF